MANQMQKCEDFAALHRSETAWIIPNPWDIGSAKMLQTLGFKALATTSSGFAYTLGKADGDVSLGEKLNHCTMLSKATDIPVSADFENGFSEQLSEIIDNVKRLAETGVAGFSIEDFSREDRRVYEFSESVERIQAIVETVDDIGVPLVITARAENLLRGVNDLDDTIRRLQAYEAAGAHVLYAPGIKSLEQLRAVTAPLKKPFNVLASYMPESNVAEFAECGASRISLGGALSSAAITPIQSAGMEMLKNGTFGWLGGTANATQVRQFLEGSD